MVLKPILTGNLYKVPELRHVLTDQLVKLILPIALFGTSPILAERPDNQGTLVSRHRGAWTQISLWAWHRGIYSTRVRHARSLDKIASLVIAFLAGFHDSAAVL